MNKIIIFTIIVLFYNHTYGQVNIDAMDYDCPKSSYKYSLLFMENIKAGNIIETDNVLKEWENKCGLREVVFRSKVLLMATDKQYSFDLPENTLDLIDDFIERNNLTDMNAKFAYEYNPVLYAYIPINETFDQFTKSMFQMIKNTDNPEMELLVDVYSGRDIDVESRLKSNEMNGTFLKTKYDSKKVNYNFKPYEELPNHFSIYGGMWSPLNKNTTIGNKAELGAQFGTKYKKWNYDFNFAVRFLKSKSSYVAYNENFDKYETVKGFTPLLFSFETSYSLVRYKKSEILLGAGLGVEWATIFPSNKNLEAINMETYNVSPVFKYRYYYRGDNYIGLRVNYNLVNYRIDDILDFNEQPLSVSLEYGVFVKDSSIRRRGWFY